MKFTYDLSLALCSPDPSMLSWRLAEWGLICRMGIFATGRRGRNKILAFECRDVHRWSGSLGLPGEHVRLYLVDLGLTNERNLCILHIYSMFCHFWDDPFLVLYIWW